MLYQIYIYIHDKLNFMNYLANSSYYNIFNIILCNDSYGPETIYDYTVCILC